MGSTCSLKPKTNDKNYVVQFFKERYSFCVEEDRLESAEIHNRREYFDKFDLIYEKMVAKDTTSCMSFRNIRKRFCIVKKTVQFSFTFPKIRSKSRNFPIQGSIWSAAQILVKIMF